MQLFSNLGPAAPELPQGGFAIHDLTNQALLQNFPRKLRPDLGQYLSEWPNMTANERRSRRPLQLEEIKP